MGWDGMGWDRMGSDYGRWVRMGLDGRVRWGREKGRHGLWPHHLSAVGLLIGFDLGIFAFAAAGGGRDYVACQPSVEGVE